MVVSVWVGTYTISPSSSYRKISMHLEKCYTFLSFKCMTICTGHDSTLPKSVRRPGTDAVFPLSQNRPQHCWSLIQVYKPSNNSLFVLVSQDAPVYYRLFCYSQRWVGDRAINTQVYKKAGAWELWGGVGGTVEWYYTGSHQDTQNRWIHYVAISPTLPFLFESFHF